VTDSYRVEGSGRGAPSHSASQSRASIDASEAPPLGFHRASGFAPEIAFLSNHGVAPGVLLAASTEAARCGVTGDAALLSGGLMGEEDYYRALARHLRVPYFCGDLAVSAKADPVRSIEAGIVPLAANGQGLAAAVAPRGQAVKLLLAAAGRLPQTFVICAPQRLAALVRAKRGPKIAEDAAGAVERRDASLSARAGLSAGQFATACAVVIGAWYLWLFSPTTLNLLCSTALWLVFAGAILLRMAAAAASEPMRPGPALAERDLPVYSIIAPLYREANVVARLIEALDALDYPKAKLDIKLVVERHDLETLSAIARLRLPARFDVIVAPAGAPATKPRALNVALPYVRGEIVVVYDAEDSPEPRQLRRAAAHFAVESDLDCLQARLVIDNADDSWLTRLFAIEYAALFDIVNPGLAALGAPIALGGTSNHFRTRVLREVGGWDAWNVTEDADLGIRLALAGRRVAALDSDTYEEAPADLRRWFSQRSRWLKGWLQTLIVHSRHPVRLVRRLGPMRAAAVGALIAGTVLGGLFGPLLLAQAIWRTFFSQPIGAPSAVETAGAVITYILMLSGFQAILIPAIVAMRQRGLEQYYRWLALLPFYYCLISLAAWAALFEFVRRPFHWSKTEHGLARTSTRAKRAGRD